MIALQPFGGVPEQQLGMAEAALRLWLPPAYRTFLATVGGGWAERPNYVADPGVDLDVLYGLATPPELHLLWAQRGDFPENLPYGVINIGGGNGGMVCLQLIDPGAGRVFWAAYAALAALDTGQRSWEPLQPLAPGFDEFLRDRVHPGFPPWPGQVAEQRR